MTAKPFTKEQVEKLPMGKTYSNIYKIDGKLTRLPNRRERRKKR